MTFPFDSSIPDAPHNPSADQPKMLANNVSTFGWSNVDHIQYGQTGAGKHKFVRIPVPVPPVATGTTEWELYTAASTLDVGKTDIFFARPNNNIPNDTFLRNTKISAGTNGYTQWFGGLIVQWGSVSFAPGNDHLTGTVLFASSNINFVNNTFQIIGTLKNSNTTDTTASNTLAIRDFNLTQFRWVYNSSSSSGSTAYPGFYWIAIGN